MTPVASIIVPTYQHADRVGDAVRSALGQTVPVEVIVVDDGSTDDTAAVLQGFGEEIRVIVLPHGGPSQARNTGLDAARGEFVMFLDADDTIEPTKIETQLRAMTPEIGWVLCDVLIRDAARSEEVLASKRYRYDDKELGGWIRPLLEQGNFIPIMSPLVRRTAVEGLRFDDRLSPEDWHFWCAVANVARVRYVPKVLATYRKSRTGRNRRPKASRRYSPNLTEPLRLNLGCGTPGTRSWHPIDGMENMDKSMGWTFEDGLGDFIDHSVHGITISHALMYVPLDRWPFVFSEFSRVLAEDGVVRITEDETENPASSRVGGWRGSDPAVTRTTPQLVREYLTRAGLVPVDVGPHETTFRDGSLKQAQHGDPPHVFFIEGKKLRGTLFAPHNDDEALFAAFTVLRYRPRVVVCFRSPADYGDPAIREAETREAMNVLGGGPVEQWDVGDLETEMRAFDARVHPVRVWAPHPDSSHPDHVAVALAARRVFGDRLVTTYHTYRDGQKVRRGAPVPFEPAWTSQKLRALARYQSQILHPRANHFFNQDLYEYEEAAS